MENDSEEKSQSTLRKFTSQGKTKTTGGKANESDEYIITNTPEATTSFPGCALLWKKFGAHFDFASELSHLLATTNPFHETGYDILCYII